MATRTRRPRRTSTVEETPDLERCRELLRRASVSRDQRRTQAQGLRVWYEHGTSSGAEARTNKLAAHIDRLTSYLWAAEGARFGIHLPPASREPWLPASQLARDEFRDRWENNGSNNIIDWAMEWSLVYGSTVVKVQDHPTHHFTLGYIDPWDFGMTREDQPLHEQDVLAHWYALSLPQFERWAMGDPREAALLAIAREHASPPAGGTPSLPRLVISGIQAVFPNTTVMGSFPGEPVEQLELLDAQVIEPVIPMVDLWERRVYRDTMNDAPYEDWHVTTLVGDARDWVASRRNPILSRWRTGPGEVDLPADHPFTIVAPRPQPSYVWGRSELRRLIELQVWREDHLHALDKALKRQLDPPMFFSGVPDFEEAGRALTSPGGGYGTPDPGGKMTPLVPQVSGEAITFSDRIDRVFADQSGLPPTTEGEAPPAGRGAPQVLAIAGIGAGRVRKLAIKLEDAVSRIATLSFQVMQRGDATAYPLKDGSSFLLAQLPEGLSVTVESHSGAPIFREQVESKAAALLKAGAIDGELFAELLDPPLREEVKVRARELAKAKSEMTEKMLELQAARFAKRGAGPGK